MPRYSVVALSPAEMTTIAKASLSRLRAPLVGSDQTCENCNLQR